MVRRDLVRLKRMAYLVSGSVEGQNDTYFYELRSSYLIHRAST